MKATIYQALDWFDAQGPAFDVAWMRDLTCVTTAEQVPE